MTSGQVRAEVARLCAENGTFLTSIQRRDGGRSFLTRRLDGGEIADPPIYSSLADALRALLPPQEDHT